MKREACGPGRLTLGRWPFVALLAIAASSCDTSPLPTAEPAEVDFGPGFLWGSASAAFQVEKGLGNTDWGLWVKTPGKIKGGDDPDVGGADALARIDEDVALLRATNQNTYRFSIEWARLYPTRAAFDADQPDPKAIAAYDKLFAALRAAKIAPFVTLQHFSLPDYLSDPRKPNEPQGWERAETIDLFATWCKRAAARWGGEVDWWATINEPLVAPIAGYIQGNFPPGVVLAVERALQVGRNETIAHAKCFDAIKAADTKDADGDGKASMVGIVQHQRAVEPEDPSYADDVAAAERVRYVNNLWVLNAVVRGDWDDDFDGKLDGPKDRKADPALANRSDYIGINYYSALVATVNGLKIPVIDAFIKQDRLANDRPKTDFHWDIYPKGFRIVLEEVRGYERPIVITENGIADSKDVNRARFLLEHLYELGKAKASGLDIRGYVYWSLLDNFEWASGFCPRFGLHSVDRTTGARVARPSAQTYARIAATGKVTKSEVDASPAYAPATPCD
ncbi:MAG: glycoside hydrolase family 1 protein [Deltaproteobacteria bacterium]|nr:glycoside hydrolase family 1 protein [Deltaproteobacteria bacterium]